MGSGVSLDPPRQPSAPTIGQTISWGAGSLQSLPNILMLKIFGQMKAMEARQQNLVCKGWNILLKDNSLWVDFLRRDFGVCGEAMEKAEETYQNCFAARRAALATGPSAQETVRAVEEESMPQDQVKTIHHVPEEVLMLIFGYLKAKDAAAAMLTCWSWNQLLMDTSLWDGFLKRDFTVLERSTDPAAVYRRLRDVSSNLSNGVYALKGGMIKDGDPIIDTDIIIPYGDEKAIVCNAWKEVLIWDFATGRCEQRFKDDSILEDSDFGFSQALLHPDGRRLILGYVNGLISILDLEHKNWLTMDQNFAGQFGFVTGLVVTKKGMFISSHFDPPQIHHWSLGCEQTAIIQEGLSWEFDEGIVNLMLTKDEKLVLGFESGDIGIISNLEGEESIKYLTLRPTHGELLSEEEEPVLGFEDGDKGALDTSGEETSSSEAMGGSDMEMLASETLDDSDGEIGNPSKFSCFILTEHGKVIAGNGHGEIFVWDLEKGALEKTFNNEMDIPIQYLALSKSGKLLVGLADGGIDIWDLESGLWENTFEENIEDRAYKGVFADQGRLILSCQSKIKLLDFTASNEAIFRELADSFELISSRSSKFRRQAMERFLRMPQDEREGVYHELSNILGLDQRYGEDAFHDENRRSSAHLQKAKAIRKYQHHYQKEKFVEGLILSSN